jgi:hypothetical protein
MRLALVIAGVLAPLATAPSALAQPAPAPGRCNVHVLRSPEPVRALIEARVRREVRCETSLVLRVVPTTMGFYLLAQSPTGRTYEMVVPDAETAAELVAAWGARVEAGTAAQWGRAPGMTPEVRPGEPPARAKAGQWVAMAATAGEDVFGIRGELDLWASNGWAAGVAVAYSEMQLGNTAGDVALEFRDLRGMVTAGHTLGRGALRLRGQVGIGMVRTQMTGFLSGPGAVSFEGAYAIGEAGVHVDLTLGRDRAWALTGGPALTLYAQSYQVSGGGVMRPVERTLDISFVGGIRRRL